MEKKTMENEKRADGKKEEKKAKSSYTKSQRVAAVVCVILLLSLYVVTLIAAVTTSPKAPALFKMSLGSTLFLPILFWFYLCIIRYFMERDKKNLKKALEQDTLLRDTLSRDTLSRDENNA